MFPQASRHGSHAMYSGQEERHCENASVSSKQFCCIHAALGKTPQVAWQAVNALHVGPQIRSPQSPTTSAIVCEVSHSTGPPVLELDVWPELPVLLEPPVVAPLPL